MPACILISTHQLPSLPLLATTPHHSTPVRGVLEYIVTLIVCRPDVRLFLNLDKNMPIPDEPDSPTDENSNIPQVGVIPCLHIVVNIASK